MNLEPRQIVEAALFVSTDPISMKKLEEITGAGKGEIKRMIKELQEIYEARDSAVEIRRIGSDLYLMQAREIFAAPLLGLVKPTVTQEVLKTLSLIALKQPIMQAEVVKSRGPITYVHVKDLLAKDFITAHPTGRTKILHTTRKFADYFGFSPDLEELKKEIARQLGRAGEESE
ncbi:SMC-Scp complex subunit ScpB [archaeon]|nr:SMC-Scp complex subunit ScpB [archaeon]